MTGASDNGVYLVDVASGKILETYVDSVQGEYSGALSVAFAPDGKTVAVAGSNGTANLFVVTK